MIRVMGIICTRRSSIAAFQRVTDMYEYGDRHGDCDFTLTFDSSPIKGEGKLVGLSFCQPALWILDQVQNDGADAWNDGRPSYPSCPSGWFPDKAAIYPKAPYSQIRV